jgi:hypothetical protein
MLTAVGALAAGSAAGIGTGAFSTATIPDRQVTVAVEQDDEATIALVPGNDPDISLSSNPGELQLDLTGANGEGTNINSVYTWGDPNDSHNDYAFKIVNNDESDYDDLVATYELDDDSWVDHATTNGNESFINFQVFNGSGYWAAFKCPNNQLSTPNPVTRNLPTSSPVDFEAGQTLYVVVTVDTTGQYATIDDDLSGKLSFEVSGLGGN